MRYLLDSNIISDFYDKFSTGHSQICTELSSLKDTDRVCLSVLTLYELEYGHANAPEEKKGILRQKLTETQQDFEVLPLFHRTVPDFSES
jgi:predicted nucleic acid-binding protein